MDEDTRSRINVQYDCQSNLMTKPTKWPLHQKRTFISAWHLPSLIRVFAVHSMGSIGPNVSSSGQRRLRSDWADAQADLSLRCMPRPIWVFAACPGWSESSLGAHTILLVLSRGGSYEKLTAANHINVLFIFRIWTGLYSLISLNFLHLFHLAFHIHAMHQYHWHK